MFGRITKPALFAVAAVALMGGCDDSSEQVAQTRPFKPALLFAANQSDGLMSTAIERGDWPAADNGYHLPDYSVYAEYYYDTTGNRNNEQNYPRRTTWGYRVTGIQR